MSNADDTSAGLIGTLLREAGLLSQFALQAMRATFRRPFEFGEIAHQTYAIGWRSLPLIMTSGLAIGVVLSMHTRAVMERFGAEALIPSALAIALISETGPLMTGLLVAGRVGAGIGAELGGMRVTEQIDALESLAVDSVHYLAVTRILLHDRVAHTDHSAELLRVEWREVPGGHNMDRHGARRIFFSPIGNEQLSNTEHH